MGLYPRPLPWLAKPEALTLSAQLVVEATLAARGFLGYLEHENGDTSWIAPRTQYELPKEVRYGSFTASEDNLVSALDFLEQLHPPLPAGTFIFVFSDFLAPVSEGTWLTALERGWDLVPVVIQDPVWERSFPDVGGVVVPFFDETSKRFVAVRLSDREAARRREENEVRAEELLARLRGLDLGPVLVTTTDREEIFQAFLEWADERIISRGRWW
jgi:hypothetical protein